MDESAMSLPVFLSILWTLNTIAPRRAEAGEARGSTSAGAES